MKDILQFIKIPEKVKFNMISYKGDLQYILSMYNQYAFSKKRIFFPYFKIYKFKNWLILKQKVLIPKNYFLKRLLNSSIAFKLILSSNFKSLFKIYKKRLYLEGVGYKVWKKSNVLKFKLGYSHSIFLKIPDGLKISLYKCKKIVIASFSKELVGYFKYFVRNLKEPDAYKKKGVRYYKEIIKLKEGKKKNKKV